MEETFKISDDTPVDAHTFHNTTTKKEIPAMITPVGMSKRDLIVAANIAVRSCNAIVTDIRGVFKIQERMEDDEDTRNAIKALSAIMEELHQEVSHVHDVLNIIMLTESIVDKEIDDDDDASIQKQAGN